jgi:hypothetical protein
MGVAKMNKNSVVLAVQISKNKMEEYRRREILMRKKLNSTVKKPVNCEGSDDVKSLIKNINTVRGPAVIKQDVIDAIMAFGSDVYYLVMNGDINGAICKVELKELVNDSNCEIIGHIGKK